MLIVPDKTEKKLVLSIRRIARAVPHGGSAAAVTGDRTAVARREVGFLSENEKNLVCFMMRGGDPHWHCSPLGNDSSLYNTL